MVEIDKLVKQYGDFCLDISLEIPDGVITGVIGKNGAGKSTMIKSILGLIKPTSGRRNNRWQIEMIQTPYLRRRAFRQTSQGQQIFSAFRSLLSALVKVL